MTEIFTSQNRSNIVCHKPPIKETVCFIPTTRIITPLKAQQSTFGPAPTSSTSTCRHSYSSSPSPSIKDMSSLSRNVHVVKEIKVTKWNCDYCRKAKFDTLKEAEQHEVQCKKDQIQKIVSCREILTSIDLDSVSRQTATDGQSDGAREQELVLDILSKLNSFDHVINTDVLLSTEIGLIVGKLKKCKAVAIKTKAKALVDTWKSIIHGQSKSSDTTTGKESTFDSKSSRTHTRQKRTKESKLELASNKRSSTNDQPVATKKPPSKKLKKVPSTTAPIFHRANKTKTRSSSASSNTSVKGNPNRKKSMAKPDVKPLASIFTRPPTKSKDKTCIELETSQNCIPVKEIQTEVDSISVLDNKKVLTEHRKAEFLIKRRRVEEERRAKKNIQHSEQLKDKYNANEGEKPEVASIFQPKLKSESKAKTKRRGPSGTKCNQDNLVETTVSRGSRKSENTSSNLPSNMPIDDCRRPTKSTSLVIKEKDDMEAKLLYLKMSAPRFPVPNYTMTNRNEEEQEESQLNFFSSKVRSSLICAPRHQCGIDSVSSITGQISYSDRFSLSFPSDSKVEPCETDPLHSVFSSILQPAPIENDMDIMTDPKNCVVPQTWSNKYAMNLLPHDVHGEENQKTAEDLLSFIRDWKEHRKQAVIAAEKARRKGKGNKSKTNTRKRRYEYDDDFISDSDLDDDLCKIYVLAGPVGSGKSSLVYAAAKNSQCPVLEINTTHGRDGTSLKKAIEECTQSHSNLALLKGKGTIFGDTDLQDTDDEDESSRPSLALVLIDEVDLLFEADVGFWPSLLNLSKKAKCPIILTASTLPPQLDNSSGIVYRFGHLTRPTPMECAQKMCLVAKMENMNWQNGFEDQNEIKEGLATIAKVLKCDIRRILNEMQSYNNSSASTQSKRSYNKTLKPYRSRLLNCNVNYPTVETISPQSVSSTAPSVIQIRGKNFLTLGRSFSSAISVEVMVGEQQCLLTKIINDCTIVAVCPPCLLPNNVNEFGNLKGTPFQRSFDCKYHSIVLKFCSVKGMVHRLDSSLQLCYNFLEEDPDFELSPKPNNKQDVSVTELLKKTIENLGESDKIDTADMVGASPRNKDDKEGNLIDERRNIKLLAKVASNASDAILLEDFSIVGQPFLAGAVSGCGEGKNKISSNATTHHFGGCSDTFMTGPAWQRDRFLNSSTHELARGAVAFHSISNNNCPALNGDESESDVWFTPETRNSSSEEDLFLPSPASFCSDTIPGLIRKSLEMECTDFTSLSLSTKLLFLKNERSVVLERTQQLVKSILEEKNLHVANRLQKSLDYRVSLDHVSLDYVSTLRNIATVEKTADENFAELLAHSDITDEHSSRRRTRRGAVKPREHYFEHIIGLRNNKTEAKETGEKLAVDCLLHSY